MIRIAIELVPHGAENAKRDVAVVEVGNVWQNEEGTLADYMVEVKSGEAMFGRVPRFTVCRWQRGKGILPLMIRVLEGVERYVGIAQIASVENDDVSQNSVRDVGNVDVCAEESGMRADKHPWAHHRSGV